MIALLSPAKKLTLDAQLNPSQSTQPALLADIKLLMATTRRLSKADLQRLMGISEALAQLNHDRFQNLSLPFTAENAHPAALCFAGDTYLGLDASTLDSSDLAWGQDHLGILSGLYGLLRPLDLMQPYRLEMGTRLSNPRGKDLYAFWKEHITAELHDRLDGQADDTVINLASKEYFSAVDPKGLPGKVITPVFLEEKDGKSRTISFMAKKARGSMARFLLEERLESPNGLKDFTAGAYAFDEGQSSETRWVFRRPQPPPVGG
jgi:cytoplasmic iron level regulating protein YaaA (DUF328/UPF0246 family)